MMVKRLLILLDRMEPPEQMVQMAPLERMVQMAPPE